MMGLKWCRKRKAAASPGMLAMVDSGGAKSNGSAVSDAS